MGVQNSTIHELINVNTKLVTVTIKKSELSGISMISDGVKESIIHVECDDEFDINFYGDAENVVSAGNGRRTVRDYKIFPVFFEQQRYEIIIESREDHNVEFWHENPNLRACVSPVGSRKNLLTGILNFGNDIGYSDLIIFVEGRQYLKITIEVFPSKIDYKDDYKAIIADVTAEIYNLAFDFLKKTYEKFGISNQQQSSPVEFFAILRKVFKRFLVSTDMVLSRPHHALVTSYAVLPGNKIKYADSKTIKWLNRHPDQTKRSDQGLDVVKAMSVQKRVTYDTKENRFTKYILISTKQRLEIFKKQYLELPRDADNDILDQIDQMIREISRRCDYGFLREIDSVASDVGMSLVFELAPGYSEMYRFWLMLKHGLSISGSIFNASVKDLAVLYEYWCFVKLNSLIRQKYELISQDIIKTSNDGLFVTLIKGQRSNVKYLNPDNGEKIVLSYNPKEENIPTVSQRPDNVLRLEKRGKRGGESHYEYVFDAKYRLNSALLGSDYRKHYSSPGPKEEDINTMHRYRDAIVCQNDLSPYERKMFGAYVLFPYRNEEEYRKHHFYNSIEKVNVGGLPFLPSATGLVTEFLDDLIADSPESAFERATLPQGIEERLEKIDWNQKDVLIGFVRNPSQLRTCLEKNFYYTYKRNISDEHLPIYYVAMYQKLEGIRYFGRVIRIQEVVRSEIPGKATALYEKCYRFDVDEWKCLPTPIRVESYGPRPISYTNYFLLTHSSSYPELHLKSEDEYRFYIELRRLTDEAIIEEDGNTTGFIVGDIKVIFSDGEIMICRDKNVIGKYTIGEFSRYPSATFRKIQRDIRSYAVIEA